jgi:hypothetical protein
MLRGLSETFQVIHNSKALRFSCHLILKDSEAYKTFNPIVQRCSSRRDCQPMIWLDFWHTPAMRRPKIVNHKHVISELLA